MIDYESVLCRDKKMVETLNDSTIGSDAVAVETVVLALLSPLIWEIPTEWEHYWIFQAAFFGCITIMLFRVMAGKADDPNVEIIQSSLQWSSILLQISLIGGLITATAFIGDHIVFLSDIGIFVSISILTALLFALLDQFILGEYAGTWRDIIYQHTEKNWAGNLLRQIADFGAEEIKRAFDGDSNDQRQNPAKAALLAIGLLTLIVFISSPIWYFLSEWFAGTAQAVLVLLSFVFLRDAARYVYINYGAAQSFDHVSWPLRWEFLFFIGRGILLAGMFGLL